MKRLHSFLVSLFLGIAALAAVPAVAATPPFIWIEGETPSSQPEGGADKFGYELGKMQSPLLSGSMMLMWTADEKKAAQIVPAEGVVFGYDFEAKEAGQYEAWFRIGYEGARSPLEWRLDNGQWTRMDGASVSAEIVALGRFFETGWVHSGGVALTPGRHRIEMRVLRPTAKNAKGEEVPTRLLYSLDAICLSKGPFVPNFKLKPGETFQTDADRTAAEKLFKIEAPASGSASPRAQVELSGTWQLASWPESSVDEATRLTGPEKLPALDSLAWYSTDVPGDLRKDRPEFRMVHRYLLRTKFEAPAALKGNSFHLEFQRFGMVAAVFVNGKSCGSSRDFNALWNCDITAAVKPGQTNDLVVVIKDSYYAAEPAQDPTNLLAKAVGARAFFSVPEDFLVHMALAQHFDMPVSFGNGLPPGILEPVTLIATGPVYVDDVFAQPSVKGKKLSIEITLNNSGAAGEVTVENEVMPWSRDLTTPAPVEKKFAPVKVTMSAGNKETVTFGESWENPKLWWPDAPNLYNIVTTVKRGGAVVDRVTTRFGFREWGWDKPLFTLNGVRWQFWAGVRVGNSPQEFLKICGQTNQNILRFWNMEGWGGMTKRQIFDFMDENGIVVRASLPLDGEGANYGPGLSEPAAGGERTYRKSLFTHSTEEGRAYVRSSRNHPSILIWSIENEVTFINAQNLGQGPVVEPALRIMAEEMRKVDPTRPSMVDGGNALRPPAEWKGVGDDVRALGPMPVSGGHYMETGVGGMDLRDYPDASYSNELWIKNRQRGAWFTLPDRPMFHGEIFFGNGYSPEKMAQFGGEEALQSRADTAAARALFMRMMSEGYRWGDTSAAWHFWDELYEAKGIRAAWSPVAVLCREWNWTFGSGEKIKRTFKVFNQASKSDPLDVAWTLSVAGKTVSEGKRQFSLAAGGVSEPFAVELALPVVKTRTAAVLTLTANRAGQEVFHNEQTVGILPPAAKPSIQKGELAVFDPKGEAKVFLQKLGVPFASVDSPDALAASPAKVLLVGRDAVPEDRAADPLWLRLVAGGKRLVVLEQNFPLRYQAVAGDIDVSQYRGGDMGGGDGGKGAAANADAAQYRGRIAFPEDLTNPCFNGLAPEDFFCWSGDHTSYKLAYGKPTTGARSLLQCDASLSFTAFVESRVGTGLMILNQTLTGEKLGTDAVARRLLVNALNHAAAYKTAGSSVATVLPAETPLAALLAQLRVKAAPAADPVAAITGQAGIAVVQATPDNLSKLAASKDKLAAFTGKGGWLVLTGLEPAGIEAFDKIVEVPHFIRPFTLESTGVAIPRDAKAAGLGLRDLVMSSGEKVAPWMGLLWMADDIFSYVVDTGDDIAPFCTINGEPPKAKAARSPEVRNVVNGFTSQEFWKYICYFDMSKGAEPKLVLELPAPATVKGFEMILNTSYRAARKLIVTLDSDPTPIEFICQPDGSTQRFDLPARKVSKVTILLSDMTDPDKTVTGVDNMRLFIERDDAFNGKVHPLTRPGGMVRYPMGKGGVLLDNLLVKTSEANPANSAKKANITKVLLENLGAEFAGMSAVVPGSANLRFTPLKPRDDQFTAFTNLKGEPSWFHDSRAKEADLSILPVGQQKLGGVSFGINDFSTSPVPTVIMLAGAGSRVKVKEMKNIPVDQKADALFFLHTFGAGYAAMHYDPEKRRANDPDPVVLRYQVNYADGKSVVVPVLWNEGIGNWLQEKPLPLKSASVAWSAPARGAEQLKITLYSMQWNNPRPEVAIQSVDILQGTARDIDTWGAPAVIAISAAVADKK